MVQVGLNGTTADAAVQVTPPPPEVVSLLPSPLPIVVGATGSFTVTLNVAQLTNTDVAFVVDDPAIVQVPNIVTVPAGQISTTFTVSGLQVGSAVVTASIGTSTVQATVDVLPQPPTIVSLLPNPLEVQTGATGHLTLTITAAQPADTTVPLTNSAPTIIDVPVSVTVPAGQTTVDIPVTGLLEGNATVTASLNSSSATATVTVTAPPPVVTALTPATQSLAKGVPGILRVFVSSAPLAPTPVTVTSSAAGIAAVPAMVTIPAGDLFADFPVVTNGEGTAVITASLNGGSATAQVIVTPAELVTLTISPQDPSEFLGAQVPFTATGTFTDGTTPDITNQVTWTSSDENIATIASDGIASALAVGSATITATSGTIAVTSILTVLPTPTLTIDPATANMQVGQTVAFTVTTSEPADVGGLTVTLAQSGSGSVTIDPISVVIPVGDVTTSFNVTADAGGSVLLTASAPLRTDGTANITIALGPPAITDVTPLTGPVGTPVTITGLSFDPTAGNTQVTFTGDSGPITAIITSITSTTITTTVPQDARSGPITVTTPLGNGASPQPFTVTLPGDFTVAIGPTTGPVVQGDQTSFVVSVAGSGTFTGLVDLSIVGLPAGVTAQAVPQLVAPGSQSVVTVNVPLATGVGINPFSVNLVGSIAGQTITKTATANLNVLGVGLTTAVGRVLGTDQSPLPGVGVTVAEFNNGSLQLVGPSTTTDASGNFLLQNMPAGQQILFVDGSTAQVPGKTYPPVDIVLTFPAGQTTRPPFTIYLPELDVANPIDLPLDANGFTTQEVRATTPTIPDLEVIIPANTRILDNNGQVVSQITISPVPTDRAPMPPPNGVVARMLFTLQPGLAKPSNPVPICFPNSSKQAPGQQAAMYYFNLEIADWDTWGTGTVTNDGNQVCSDPGFGLPSFAWHFPGGEPTEEECDCKEGDPVDLYSGQFVLDEVDLTLTGLLPIPLTRHYASRESTSRGFGVGTTHNYNWFLQNPVGSANSDFAVLVGPNGRQAVFVPDSTSGNRVNRTEPWLAGAVLTGAFTSPPMAIRFKNGLVWDFNGDGNLIAQRDRNGNQLTITREADSLNNVGRVTEVKDEVSGRALRFFYDSGDQITQILDPIGRQVRYAYDGTGRLITVTDPMGHVTRYSYDLAGRMETITDRRGNVQITNEYDGAGRVIKQTQADGGIWQFAYQVDGGLVTNVVTTDPNGNVTQQRMNSAGFGLDTLNGLGQGVSIERAIGTNFIISKKDQLGRQTFFARDGNGNLTSITEADGNITRLSYEPVFSQVDSITNALTQEINYGYDANGNLTSTEDSNNQLITLTYNAKGQRLSIKDSLNNTTTFEYDIQGNLVIIKDPLLNLTSREYDSLGRVVKLTDPRGIVTQFRYDSLDRVTEIADGKNRLTKFSYDGNGNLIEVLDAKGQITKYTYDPMNRRTSRSDALGRTQTSEYDQVGNLKTFTDRKGQITQLDYDSLNRRTNVEYGDGSTVSVGYDSEGRMIEVVDSISGSIEFNYDEVSRGVSEITARGEVTYGYDILGRRSSMVVNGQLPVTYEYDSVSRLTKVSQGGDLVELGYDVAGRRSSVSYSNGTSITYTFDNASRLENITHSLGGIPFELINYQYDANANRSTYSRVNGSASLLPSSLQAAYDAANEQIVLDSSTPNLTYDLNGNLISKADSNGTTIYEWDVRNRLVSISGPNIAATFSYDSFGRRISKTINGQKVEYLYDRQDIIGEIEGGVLTTTFLRNLSADEPFARRSSETEFFHSDALGSVLHLTDSTGSITTSYEYDVYGKAQQSGPSVNPFQFTGRENDGTGLYYYRARYYDPIARRFLSEDPIGLQGGVNFYAYVGGNPVNAVDPSGLYGTSDFVKHYCNGGGRGVDLRQLGLLNTYRNTWAVSNRVEEFREIVRAAATEEALGLCSECDTGIRRTNLTLSDVATPNVTLTLSLSQQLFSIGHSSLRRSANCDIEANCTDREYSYSCNLAFSIQDWFVDPFDIGIEKSGCTPYPITATWFESLSGSGTF